MELSSVGVGLTFVKVQRICVSCEEREIPVPCGILIRTGQGPSPVSTRAWWAKGTAHRWEATGTTLSHSPEPSVLAGPNWILVSCSTKDDDGIRLPLGALALNVDHRNASPPDRLPNPEQVRRKRLAGGFRPQLHHHLVIISPLRRAQ
ncbi:hypothetical protein quinque_015690 [Culex quinquefasciatus]